MASREISSQDKIVVADALLSLRECQTTPSEIRAIIVSKQNEIAEFCLVETTKFYKQLLISFLQEKQKIISSRYEERLRIIKKDKETEFAKRTEKILGEKRRDIDLRLGCEMNFTNQYFRQELWIRVQVFFNYRHLSLISYVILNFNILRHVKL